MLAGWLASLAWLRLAFYVKIQRYPLTLYYSAQYRKVKIILYMYILSQIIFLFL